METVKIKNGTLEVVIAIKGAEVRSIKNIQTKQEYMWNGDVNFWTGVSPILFPVVGKTINNEVRYKGESYSQGNHGFARNSIFKIIQQTEQSITLGIRTGELGNVYPFDLLFTVTYSLQENTMVTAYSVNNLDDKIAYFSVGAHPAFKCPFDTKHSFEDYVIKFSSPENDLKLHGFADNGFFTGGFVPVKLDQFELKRDKFINDNTYVYSDMTSQYVTLQEKNSTRNITVSLTGFPWLGIWTKAGADYICIEPWCGHSDIDGFNGDIDIKSAIEVVEPKKIWYRSYSITFNYS